MTNVSYDAMSRRLRIEGTCTTADLHLVKDAVCAFQRLAGDLIIDLTASTHLSGEVADFLVRTQTQAKSRGKHIVLLRRLDGPVDRALTAAAGEVGRSHSGAPGAAP